MSKLKLPFLVTGSFLLLAIMPLQVVAQEQESPAVTQDETTTSEQTDERKNRLDEYKIRRNVELSQAAETRLQNRCVTAQERLVSINEKAISALERRTTAYTNIIERLKQLTEKLELANVDVSSLTVVVADIESESQNILAKLNEQQTAIEDTVSIDCTEDPSGFKAALEQAKVFRSELKIEVLEFRKMINENLKSELQLIREQLKASGTETDENELSEE